MRANGHRKVINGRAAAHGHPRARVRANDPRKGNGRMGLHGHPRARVRVLANDHRRVNGRAAAQGHPRVWTGVEANTHRWGNVHRRTCDQDDMSIGAVVD